MELANAIRQLARDLRSQRLRTALTAFGIVWGTTAVSLLVAFGQGLQTQLLKNAAGIGDRVVIAWPSRTSKVYEGLGKGRPIRVTDEDVARIRSEVPGLRGVSEEYSGNLSLRRGAKTFLPEVSGVVPIFADIRNVIPAPGGRFVNEVDERDRRRVAFFGDQLAKEVFGKEDPVGQTVLISGTPFLVVGVLQKKEQDSSYNGRDEERIFIPASTYRAITGRKEIDNFVFRAANVDETEAMKTQVVGVLARKHRFDPTDKEAVSMWDTTEMIQFFNTFMLGFRLFLGVVGSLTLVVGGIGVSNIMNVVVEERTREIGIKMALGAKPGGILRQILLETLVITGVGGALGLGITAGICAVFPAFGIGEYVGEPHVSPLVAGLTAGLLGVVALLAGYFPARDAARLDPVAAMKA
jgi:putative ABC transport system permease protein